MRRQQTLVLLVVIWPLAAWGDSISNVQVSPSRPASLSHGEQVKITFEYSTDYVGEIIIMTRAVTGGKPTMADGRGSGHIYTARTGTGSGDFTITSEEVFVDGIRFEILAGDRDSTESEMLLHQETIPVRFRFSDDPFRGAAMNRHLCPDGSLEIPNPDGSARLYRPDGRLGYRKTTGEVNWTSLIKLQPPGPVNEADTKWIDDLDKWLGTVGENLLKSIEKMVGDPTVFQNYKQYEDSRCQTLYQRIEMRQVYLGLLIQVRW